MDASLEQLILETLGELGFSRTDGDSFSGKIQVEGYGEFQTRIQIPPEFPSALPAVSFPIAELPQVLPHIDQQGKSCLAHATGLLLDRRNPAGILRESVERATQVLIDGLSGRSDQDFIEELNAYWQPRSKMRAISLVEPNQTSRKIVLAGLEPVSNIPNTRKYVFADTAAQLSAWIGIYGAAATRTVPAYYLALDRPVPREFATEEIGTAQLISEVGRASSTASLKGFQEWLRGMTLPAFVLISMPVKAGRTVVAVELRSSSEVSKGGMYTFRKGTLRASQEAADSPGTTRIGVDRFDRDFLLPRGGAEVILSSSTVAVVGCGAVGSFVAFWLAKTGVGTIKLIDPETLTNENVHRHVLGVSDVGTYKAEALAGLLSRQLPHLSFPFKNSGVFEILRSEKNYLDVQLLINATGDETLGLELNERLRNIVPILHAWNDPLSLGGHVLLTIPEMVGCYECLFDKDPDTGVLYNRSSFVAVGENVTKTFAGCAGVFVPFSVLDASQTALECISVAKSLFLKAQKKPLLRSWFGEADSFTAAGFHVSSRASMFSEHERKDQFGFERVGCIVCGGVV
jgi:molybdopterin-synthase adenylyltransferase